MQTQHIPNPGQKQLIVTNSGLKFADSDQYLFFDKYFDIRYRVPENFNFLHPILNIIPPSADLHSGIIARKNQQINVDGIFYQSTHRHADMFFHSGSEFIKDGKIDDAMICKQHLIRMWDVVCG